MCPHSGCADLQPDGLEIISGIATATSRLHKTTTGERRTERADTGSLNNYFKVLYIYIAVWPT